MIKSNRVIRINLNYFSNVNLPMSFFYVTLIILSTIAWSQPENELTIIISDEDKFVFHPEKIYVKDNLFYSANTDSLFTGRFSAHLKYRDNEKILECTITRGMKSGYLSQSYNRDAKVIGINGLYVNNKKEGNWIWIEPEMGWKYESRFGLDQQVVTSIDYVNGRKNGHVSVYKLDASETYNNKSNRHNNMLIVKGVYLDGRRQGIWQFYDDIFSEHDRNTIPYDLDKSFDLYTGGLPIFWTRERVYDSSVLQEEKCREPYRDLDCADYQEKYSSNIYKFNPPEIVSPKSKTKITEQMFTVKDYIGEDVEINPVLFLQHINKYHANGISIHKQDGRSFKIDNDLRERLKLITFWQ